MKKIFFIVNKIILIFLLLTCLVSLSAKLQGKVYATENKVWNEVVDALNKETKTYTSFNQFIGEIKTFDAEALISEYNSRSPVWKSTFLEAKLVYEKYSSDSDEQLKEVVNKATNATNQSLEALTQYDQAFSGDLNEEEMNVAVSLGDSLIIKAWDEHDKAVDLYNDYSGYSSQQNTMIILYFASVIALIFSLILWLKSRTSTNYKADIIKSQIFKNLFASSLWFSIGLLITTVSLHYATDNGGTYYVFYWAMLVGGWQMLIGFWTYFTKDRKVLLQLKHKDQSDMLLKTMKEA